MTFRDFYAGLRHAGEIAELRESTVHAWGLVQLHRITIADQNEQARTLQRALMATRYKLERLNVAHQIADLDNARLLADVDRLRAECAELASRLNHPGNPA